MAEGLVSSGQQDFSAGIFRSVSRQLIPPTGVYDAVNALLNDDGVLYRRGGSTYGSGSAVGESTRWVWDGYFAAGRRTIYANPSDFVVLAADDSTPVNIGGSGLTEPKSSALVGGMLFIGGGTIYAGSRKTAGYSTGTVVATQGSKVLVGTGTTWVANVDPGMLVRVAGAGRYYVVDTVVDNTHLQLNDPFEPATVTGGAYAATVLGDAATHGARVADIYVAAANRLFTLEGDHIYFSNGISPTGVIRTHVFSATDYHLVSDGARCVAGAELAGVVLVFTTGGMWRITNVAYNLVDATGNVQQQLQKLSSEIIAWGAPGIASWQNAIVVAAVDGVYLVDGVSAPVPLARSITPVITDAAQAGLTPGGMAVYRNHLHLPILSADAAAVDSFWVCRMDRSTDTQIGAVAPWTRLTGLAGEVGCLTVRAISGSQRLPELLGAPISAGQLLKLSTIFAPSADVKNEADGSTHGWIVETRDIATGPGNQNLVRSMRALFELVADAGDMPRISAYASVGVLQAGTSLWGAVDWGEFDWSDTRLAEFVLLQGAASPDEGRYPYTFGALFHTARIRYRFQSSAPAASMVLRSFEHFIRQSGSIA